MILTHHGLESIDIFGCVWDFHLAGTAIWDAGFAASIFSASATTSMYLSPEPVLKITTLSVGFRKPSCSSRWYAGNGHGSGEEQDA